MNNSSTDLDYSVPTSPALDSPAFRGNDMSLKILLACYVLFWCVMAISPVSRFNWLVQNAMPSLFAGGLITSYNRFRFSTLSYFLITVFMMLHVIGAHYTYAQVPLGDWIKDTFGLSRNCFDRIVHFCFGLLMTYPLRETLFRLLKLERALASFLSLSGVVAFSAMWEILESWLAQVISPGSGAAYLGAQGDLWDAQNDMAVAFYGSVLSLGVTIVRHRLFENEAMLTRKDATPDSSPLST